jgi:hypothetical protein
MDGAVAISLTSCGAEANARGFALITGGSHSIALTTCRGVENNGSGDRTIGSFVEIAGGNNYGVKIDSCEDTRANAATSVNIRAGANTGKTTIIGYCPECFPKGYTNGSDPTWLARNLSLI